MTDNELRKCSRAQLLELLVSLSEENDSLRGEITHLNRQLEDRSMEMREFGSLAEASMKLSGVFVAAQDAADRYVENVRRLSSDAERNAVTMVEDARRKCAEIEAEAQMRVESKWESLREWLDGYLEAHQELKSRIGSIYGERTRQKSDDREVISL